MAMQQSDPRYQVYAALVHRSITEKKIVSGDVYRVAGTDVEFELLQHGEEAFVDGIKWRITGKNKEKGCFFLFGDVSIPVGDVFIRCRPTDPINRLEEEFSKWEITFRKRPREVEISHMWHTIRSFFYHLVQSDQMTAYLDEPESNKEWYREASCGGALPVYEPKNKTELGVDLNT